MRLVHNERGVSMALLSWSWCLACVALVACSAPGCAHSEDEWRAKVREVDDLKAQLGRAEAQRGSASKARDDAGARLDKIERDLREAGVEPDAIKANVELSARAVEEHRLRAEQRAAAKKRLTVLRDRLAPLAKEGVVASVRHNKIVVTMPGDAMFDANRETLRREGRDLLAKVAEVIRGEPSLERRAWQVAGHLDAGKPGGAFRDAWGLSAMRAREVAALLREPVTKGGGGLRAAQISVAGYADADPIAASDTPENKAKNRRCELVLVPSPEETVDITDLGK